jgi:hypothetical protein
MSLFDNIFGWCLRVSNDTKDSKVQVPETTRSEELPTDQAIEHHKTDYRQDARRKTKPKAIHVGTTSEAIESNKKGTTNLLLPPNEDVGHDTAEDIMSSTSLSEQLRSRSNSHLLPKDLPIEEETNRSYSSSTWYSVLLGEVLAERYQILTKLGYGDTSTVWLAYDNR